MSEHKKVSELNDELLLPITVESKKSVERLGMWNSEKITSIEYLPMDAPFNLKLYMRLRMTYLNQRAILESLILNSGAMDIHKYMDLMQEMEKNMKELETHYKTQSVSLLLVDRSSGTQSITVKLFDTKELCNYYLKGAHGFSVEDIETNNVPAPYLGTRIQKQEWHTSQEQILKNYPNITNTDLAPKEIAGEI